MKTRLFGPHGLGSVLVGAAAGLVLAGCASDGGGETGSDAGETSDGSGETGEPVTTEGVPFGASIEEYQAAFEDVEPVTLRVQTDGPEGSLSNVGREAWAGAIEEWSGEKITFEWGYSNSFVPSATEWAAGLADGRIDAAFFLPYYTPDVFPTLSTLTDATFLDGNRPLSTLVSAGWVTEVTFALPEYAAEAAENGVHILTLAPSANIPGIYCTEDRTSQADFTGVPISASGQGRVEQLESLGFAPQSIAFTELYEALQRGVVGCGSTVPSALDTIGAVDLVPYAVADPEASLVGFPNYLAVGKETWDSLPLVAQQLLFDRLDVFLAEELKARSERNANWLDQIHAAGGGIKPLQDDARERLLEVNEGLLDELASHGADTEAFVSAFDEWNSLVNDDLYPDVTSSLEEFLAARDYETVDVRPFVDAFFQEVLLGHRPG